MYCAGGSVYRLYEADGKTCYLAVNASYEDGSFNVSTADLKFTGTSASFSHTNNYQIYKSGNSVAYDRYTSVQQRLRVVKVEGVNRL